MNNNLLNINGSEIMPLMDNTKTYKERQRMNYGLNVFIK